MEIALQYSTTRNMEWASTETTFFEGLDMILETRFSFGARIEVYKGSTLVGDFYSLVFDEDTIESAGEDLVSAANMIDVDVEGPEVKDAIKYLVRSDIFKQEIYDCFLSAPLFDCYIQNLFFYTKDENENRIIAEYLFKNLSDIFLYFFNIRIRCFVSYPAPRHINYYGQEVDTPDKDGAIRKKMIEFHKKMGYTQLEETGFFAINCFE